MADITVNLPSTKSWKTTLAGAVAAAGGGMAMSEDPTIQLVGKILTIVGAILIGMFAKDSNVSGGTVSQESSPEVKAAVTTAPTPAP